MTKKFHLGILLSMIACAAPHTDRREGTIKKFDQIELARWVIGSWYNNSSNATNYEVWEVVNDSTFSGCSYSISNGDTVSAESIRLLQRNGELAYIPTVSGQNKGMPIEFKQAFISGDKMIFENPDHDFPQMITYQHLAPDSLLAEISGVIEGERRTIHFPMRRSE